MGRREGSREERGTTATSSRCGCRGGGAAGGVGTGFDCPVASGLLIGLELSQLVLMSERVSVCAHQH